MSDEIKKDSASIADAEVDDDEIAQDDDPEYERWKEQLRKELPPDFDPWDRFAPKGDVYIYNSLEELVEKEGDNLYLVLQEDRDELERIRAKRVAKAAAEAKDKPKD